MTVCLFSGAALAIILVIAVAIGMIIFLFGLLYIRRFRATSFFTYVKVPNYDNVYRIVFSTTLLYRDINCALATYSLHSI